MAAISEGAARANELGDHLEAICKRFERGATPRIQDVTRIRKASITLKRLAFVAEALAMTDSQLREKEHA
jgi:hypothetical protein